MIRRLLKDASLSELTDFVSPAFFEVIPPRTLRRQLGGLARNMRRRRDFQDALSRQPVPEEVGSLGDAVLRLYFQQLLSGPDTLLDLRASAFAGPDKHGRITWSPAPIWVTWEPDFLLALRQLYSGFYDGDMAAFDSACDAMNLHAAREVLLDHFGSGDQTAVAFDPAAFRETFHKVFIACRDAGEPLPGGFVPLGIYLGTLYEHMDQLGGTWDVRAAWSSVR